MLLHLLAGHWEGHTTYKKPTLADEKGYFGTYNVLTCTIAVPWLYMEFLGDQSVASLLTVHF